MLTTDPVQRAKQAFAGLGRYYEGVRGNDCKLRQFLKNAAAYALLHEHLQGSIRPRTWARWSQRKELDTSYVAYKQFQASCSVLDQPDNEHSAFFGAWEGGVGEGIQQRSGVDLGVAMIDEFWQQKVLYAEPLLEFETVLPNHADYEAPCDLNQAFVKKLAEYLTELDRRAGEIHGTEHSIFTASCPIQLKFKIGILRCIGNSVDENLDYLHRQLVAVHHAMEANPNVIVGFDLVMPEDSRLLPDFLEPQLNLVEELGHFFPSITLHAGELTEKSGTEYKALRDNLPLTLQYTQKAKKLTLGHCVAITEQGPGFARLFKDRDITIVCLPKSNELILGLKPSEHPISYMLDWIPATQICISSDDQGVACAGIAENYFYAIRALGERASWDWLCTTLVASFERSHLTGEGLFEVQGGHYILKDHWPQEGELARRETLFVDHLVKMAYDYQLIS